MAERHGPIPDDAERVQFLLDRLGPDLAAFPLLLCTLIAVALQLGRGEGLRRRLLSELARKVDSPVAVGSLAALEAAVAESDRTLGALIG